jgi:hypothetical protein
MAGRDITIIFVQSPGAAANSAGAGGGGWGLGGAPKAAQSRANARNRPLKATVSHRKLPQKWGAGGGAAGGGGGGVDGQPAWVRGQFCTGGRPQMPPERLAPPALFCARFCLQDTNSCDISLRRGGLFQNRPIRHWGIAWGAPRSFVHTRPPPRPPRPHRLSPSRPERRMGWGECWKASRRTYLQA